MPEGSLMEIVIAVGAAVTVMVAVGSIVYRIVVGDGQKRRLEKLKDELAKKG